MLRDREGYVSFSDVAGLGEPEGVEEEEEERGKSGNWWKLLGLVRA
jgi:hypothetical protein